MKRVYVAGPMTGLPALNFPAFHAAALDLRAIGLEAVNPAELCDDIAGDWQACMRRDITALLTCDGIALLPGWQASKGATLEHHIGQRLGLDCRDLIDWLPDMGDAADAVGLACAQKPLDTAIPGA